MKALTLHQPWASLMALGVKTIETRSWSTGYRGPLLIHAGAKSPKANVPVGEWRTMRWERGADVSLCRRPSTTPIGEPFLVALPLGAVVASCTLADVVPIRAERPAPTKPALDFRRDGLRLTTGGPDALGILRDWHDVTDQLPYGDFAPGRFAWLLEDVKATTERCPACWKMAGGPNGGVAGKDWSNACPVCIDVGRCDPIPAKGHQRLWEWKS